MVCCCCSASRACSNSQWHPSATAAASPCRPWCHYIRSPTCSGTHSKSRYCSCRLHAVHPSKAPVSARLHLPPRYFNVRYVHSAHTVVLSAAQAAALPTACCSMNTLLTMKQPCLEAACVPAGGMQSCAQLPATSCEAPLGMWFWCPAQW
jgi:hypothetical protein